MIFWNSELIPRIEKTSLEENEIYQEVSFFEKQYDPEHIMQGLYTCEVLELGIVMSGEGEHRISEKAIPCKEGDVFIIGENMVHGYYAQNSNNPLVVRRLWFDPVDWFEGIYRNAQDSRYCYGVFEEGRTVGCAVLTQSQQKMLLEICDNIENELLHKKAQWRTAVKAYLSVMLVELGRCVGKSVKNRGKLEEWNLVTRTIEVIKENFEDSNLTLESIAAQMFVSKGHLSRLFKMLTGEAFSDYLKKVRLDYAGKLLSETDMSIDEIVFQCGLKDLVSFRRAFLAYKGYMPREYRKIGATVEKRRMLEERESDLLEEISLNVLEGKSRIVEELVQKAVDEGVDAERILTDGLLKGMDCISRRFKVNKVSVTEVIVATRSVNLGIKKINPYFVQKDQKRRGKACIGTVQGDIHDIGKNLVKMLMENKGIQVIDLGTDVSAETFIKTAVEEECQLICCSSLLSTTRNVMEEVVELAVQAGIRDQVKIMIGGGSVDEVFCRKIGADLYTEDALEAAEEAVILCQK